MTNLKQLFYSLIFSVPVCLLAKPRTTVKNVLEREENKKGNKSSLIIPYIFSTESMGLTLGTGFMAKGYGQDQLTLASTVYASNDEAFGLYFGLWDYQFENIDRLFFSAQAMTGYYPRQRAYVSIPYKTDQTQGGGNNSDEDNYIEESGYDNWAEFKLEYVFPIGSAKKSPLQNYHLKNGLLQSNPVGGDSWNPLKSGVTTLMLRQFNRYRSFEPNEQTELNATVHPVELGISYNNTDFPPNPSSGSSQYLSITQDFGWFESNREWTFIEFEASKYFNLGESENAKQRVIALNFWTGDTPSWTTTENPDGTYNVTDHPSFYEGATLGGFYRMKAYPVDRFRDRSVIYSSIEYRHTLRRNFLGEIDWFSFLQSDWLQVVAFMEGGRVAPQYSFDELLQSWQFDAGIGLRAMLAGGVIRLDAAFSEESSTFWVMFGHPF